MEHRRSQSIVQDKSFRFAVQLIGYTRRQPKDPINLVLTRQLLRSGTSIGANVEEALGEQSSKDFISKLTRRKIMTRENSELRTQNSEPVIAVDSEPKTQNSKLPSS